ncbi:hypothetical protein [Alloscardovia omnicolens]|uniref:hypothetical protein n=1 Tax=Alloscardovia omnicolens TaxID=419015 RepID=UPI003A72C28F
MNETAQSRLYLLTSIACIAWLIQSIYSYIQDGSIMHWASWVFIACLSLVIAYTGYQGWTLYKKTRPADDEDIDEDE